MTVYTYPSGQFPAQPSVSIEAPDDWMTAAVPDGVLAIREAGTDQFAANIVVSISRHTAAFDLADAITAIGREVAGYAEPQVDTPFEIKIHDRSYAALDVAFRHPEAGVIGQIHLLTGVARTDQIDVVHLTATYGGTDTDTAYPRLQSVVRTLVVED